MGQRPQTSRTLVSIEPRSVMEYGSREGHRLEFGVWRLEFGVWSLEFGAWSLELGAWRLEFGWSLPCYGGGLVGGVHGRAGDPGSRSGRQQPQRPEEVDHVRHKDVWGGNRFHHCIYPATFV